MKETIFIENLKCGGCKKSIETALSKMQHVDNVIVDLEEHSVIVEAENNEAIEDVLLRLNELGYPQIGDNTMLKKAKSFVSCAIGRTQ